MKITRAGIDIAKSVFHIHAVDRNDRPQWQAKLKRREWLDALCDRLASSAEVMFETLINYLSGKTDIEEVVICLNDHRDSLARLVY